jgi:hypothetical protein
MIRGTNQVSGVLPIQQFEVAMRPIEFCVIEVRLWLLTLPLVVATFPMDYHLVLMPIEKTVTKQV